LISALGQVDDVMRCVTMDLKEAGNRLFLVGLTRDELGGSHFSLVLSASGGNVPQVDPPAAKQTFAAVHAAIDQGLVRACHDLSEGGLAVALAEMALAGGLGARVRLDNVPGDVGPADRAAAIRLFSESATRFVCEVPTESVAAFRQALSLVPHADIGEVTADARVEIVGPGGALCIAAPISQLKAAWQAPLDW
jgi:phosphoribosylformylglycinamidine synthase